MVLPVITQREQRVLKIGVAVSANVERVFLIADCLQRPTDLSPLRNDFSPAGSQNEITLECCKAEGRLSVRPAECSWLLLNSVCVFYDSMYVAILELVSGFLNYWLQNAWE